MNGKRVNTGESGRRIGQREDSWVGLDRPREFRNGLTSVLCLVAQEESDSDSLWPCPQDFSGKNTGVGCCFLLQGIFPTQGANLRLLNSWWILYPLSHWETPVKSDGIGVGEWLIWILCLKDHTPCWRVNCRIILMKARRSGFIWDLLWSSAGFTDGLDVGVRSMGSRWEKERKMVVDWGKLGFRGGSQVVCLGLIKFENSTGRGSWIFTSGVEEEKSGLEMTSGLWEARALTPYTEGICLGKEDKVAQNWALRHCNI